MNINIVREVTSVDENGDEVTSQVSTEFTVALDSGILSATNTETGVIKVEQPFTFNPDGTKKEWTDLDEGIAWLKEALGHIGE